MGKQIKDFCQKCDVCQRQGNSNDKTKAKLCPLPIISTPFQSIGLDIVGPLPTVTLRGEDPAAESVLMERPLENSFKRERSTDPKLYQCFKPMGEKQLNLESPDRVFPGKDLLNRETCVDPIGGWENHHKPLVVSLKDPVG